jgi:hypothetical protein
VIGRQRPDTLQPGRQRCQKKTTCSNEQGLRPATKSSGLRVRKSHAREKPATEASRKGGTAKTAHPSAVAADNEEQVFEESKRPAVLVDMAMAPKRMSGLHRMRAKSFQV